MAIVSSANVFTVAQTFNAAGYSVLAQDGSGNTVVKIGNIDTGGKYAAAIVLHGTNGLGPTKEAFQLGVDTSATTADRDFFLAKVLASGNVSDPDGIYVSNGGTNPSTVGIGFAQPGDSGGSYRLKVASGGTTQGGLLIRQFASQTAHMLGLVDSGGTTEHVWVDPSNANTWLTVLTGDTSVANPVLRIVDGTTNATITFEAQATGTLHLKNPGANSINFQVGNSNQTAQINLLATGEMNIGTLSATNVIAIGNHNTSWNSLGFFGTSAVVKQTSHATTTGFTAGAGTAVDSAATFTGGTGATAYTIGDLVLALKTYGLLTA